MTTKALSIKIALIAAGTAAAVMSTSCSSSDEKNALALLESAQAANDCGNSTLSLELLDSLDRTYPSEIETRRKALHLRTKANEGKLVRELEEVEMKGAMLQLKSDSLQKFVAKVDNPLEPYFVAKEMAGKSIVGSTGLEARMMPDGTLYLISSLKGTGVRHVSVTVTADGKEASTATIACDGERNDRSLGYEVIHYMPGESSAVVDFIASHRESPVSVRFNGEGGKHSETKLDDRSRRSIATLADVASTTRELRHNLLEQQKLNRQIELARNQAAQTYIEDEDSDRK